MHKGKLYARKTNFLIILLDSTIVVLSFCLSLLLRKQFPRYLMEPWQFLLLLPYVVLIRTLILSFFEHYRTSLHTLQLQDIWSLFIHNLIPSSVFVIFRLLSPVRMLRIPFSMILTEYFFTLCGMIVIRFIFLRLSKRKRPSDTARRKK